VAIIVARILARIEAIKIPAPAPAAAPQVTRTDVQTIQRLVNEFRAELAALGVRTTAVEEELTALKARSTNVTIKGDQRLRYNFWSVPTTGFGAPTGFTTAQYRHRLTFTGRASSTVSVTTRVRTGPGSQISPLTSQAGWPAISFDYAYTDVSGVFGMNWRLGQQPYTLGNTGWSGYGLLYDPSNADVFQAIGVVDGAKFSGSLAGFGYEVGAWSESAASGFNIYTLGVNLGSLIPGWSLAVNGLYQARNTSVPVPVTASGPTSGATAASTANTNDTGYEALLTGSVFPGLTVGLDYAGFNPGGAAGGTSASSNAYAGWVAFDASAMLPGTTLTAWYKNYGSTSAVQMPFHSGATTEIGAYAPVTWNFNGWGGAVDTKFGANWTGSFSYESGNQTITGGSTVQEYYGSLGYAVTSGATIAFKYFNWKLAGVDQANFYRVEFTTSY
jgi:hypothetical protein